MAFVSPMLSHKSHCQSFCGSGFTSLRQPVLLKRSKLRLGAKKKSTEGTDGSMTPSLPKRKESEVEKDVLEAAKESGPGFDSDPPAQQKLIDLLEELEALNGIENPARSASLWGTWQLLFTNSPPMLKNKGVTGLGSLPFVAFEELTQEFQSDGSAETVEILRMPPFGTPARSTLRGSVVAASPQVIEQTYVDVQLASVFKSQADSVGSDNYFSKAVLAITYLSDALRICRSPSGALFLFQRTGRSR